MDNLQTVKSSVVFASISVFAWICKLTVSSEWGKRRREDKAKPPLHCGGDSKVQSVHWIPSLLAVGSPWSGSTSLTTVISEAVGLTYPAQSTSPADWVATLCTEQKHCAQSRNIERDSTRSAAAVCCRIWFLSSSLRLPGLCVQGLGFPVPGVWGETWPLTLKSLPRFLFTCPALQLEKLLLRKG